MSDTRFTAHNGPIKVEIYQDPDGTWVVMAATTFDPKGGGFRIGVNGTNLFPRKKTWTDEKRAEYGYADELYKQAGK